MRKIERGDGHVQIAGISCHARWDHSYDQLYAPPYRSNVCRDLTTVESVKDNPQWNIWLSLDDLKRLSHLGRGARADVKLGDGEAVCAYLHELLLDDDGDLIGVHLSGEPVLI